MGILLVFKSSNLKEHFKPWRKVDICYYNKKEGKDQESIQSSTAPDPGYQSLFS